MATQTYNFTKKFYHLGLRLQVASCIRIVNMIKTIVKYRIKAKYKLVVVIKIRFLQNLYDVRQKIAPFLFLQ